MYRIVKFHKKDHPNKDNIYIITQSLSEGVNAFCAVYSETKSQYDIQNYEYVEIYNKDVVKYIQQRLDLDDFYLEFPYILHKTQINYVLDILNTFNYTFDKTYATASIACFSISTTSSALVCGHATLSSSTSHLRFGNIASGTFTMESHDSDVPAVGNSSFIIIDEYEII